jgi:hypothetical protein
MSWWPWQSGKSRNREQKAESLSRLTATSTKQLEAAGADNRRAIREAHEAVARRAQTSGQLRPVLKKLITRLAEPQKDAR